MFICEYKRNHFTVTTSTLVFPCYCIKSVIFLKHSFALLMVKLGAQPKNHYFLMKKINKSVNKRILLAETGNNP